MKMNLKRILAGDLMFILNFMQYETKQRDRAYLSWLYLELPDIVNQFASQYGIEENKFIKIMNDNFTTNRFNQLAKRWLVEYLLRFFAVVDNYAKEGYKQSSALVIEDNPLHRFAIEKYSTKFNVNFKVAWKNEQNLILKAVIICFNCLTIFKHSLLPGINLSCNKKRHKIMREALWQIRGRGYYHHDDFFVDGNYIKKEDLLLFSRSTMLHEDSRFKAYQDAIDSGYGHFYLPELRLDFKTLFWRVLPLYMIKGTHALFCQINSDQFSIFLSIFRYFNRYALPYEKIFCNYSIQAELGHNYFSASHIAEAIICQNFRAKYYLMHWSDISEDTNRTLFSYLGCDAFFVWGDAHGRVVEAQNSKILMPVGYIFKKFIKEVAQNRAKIMIDMGIKAKGEIISFFDESFGGDCEMTEEHYVNFWKLMRDFAFSHREHTVIIKPKELSRHLKLSVDKKKEFLRLLEELKETPNVFIIDTQAWSFIEVIGISDIVVTQGMTSSATIALICGIEGLYLDQVNYNHLFCRLFKNSVVFNDPEHLSEMIDKLISGVESTLKIIPEQTLREFDAYGDGLGIERLQKIISGHTENNYEHHKN